jgi:hypothetical protein
VTSPILEVSSPFRNFTDEKDGITGLTCSNTKKHSLYLKSKFGERERD